MKAPSILVSALMLTAADLCAQIVGDGATKTLSNVTTNITGHVTVGTNGSPNATYAVLTATNVALPLSNWVSIATNQFDSSGNFSFTRAIVPGERQRYFRIHIP